MFFVECQRAGGMLSTSDTIGGQYRRNRSGLDRLAVPQRGARLACPVETNRCTVAQLHTAHSQTSAMKPPIAIIWRGDGLLMLEKNKAL